MKTHQEPDYDALGKAWIEKVRKDAQERGEVEGTFCAGMAGGWERYCFGCTVSYVTDDYPKAGDVCRHYGATIGIWHGFPRRES